MSAAPKIEQVPIKVAFDLTWFASMNEAVAHDCLVQDLLLAGSLIVCYGESNSGKTFLVLDLALAIASGNAWRGLSVRKGVVLYIASEGAASVRNRVAAFRKQRDSVSASTPFAIIPRAVNLLDDADVDALIATIAWAEVQAGEKVSLVVFDTLARSMAGGDENNSADMGNAIASADRIRSKTGAAVLFVHHSGKDSSKGARGSNALRCAVDTEIFVEGQSGTRKATSTKQRDLVTGKSFSFNLQPVVIGKDSEDRAVTSCVVELADAEESPATRRAPNGKNQMILLAGLKEYVRAKGIDIISSIDIRDVAKAQGIGDRRRFSEALKGLERDGWIVPALGGFRISGNDL